MEEVQHSTSTSFLRKLFSSSNDSSNSIILDPDYDSHDHDHRMLKWSSKQTELTVEIMSNIFLFLLIFGLSATVDIDALVKQLKNKFALTTGIIMQFLFMPFLGYVAVLVLQNYGLSPAMGITLLIVTASPGGSYSNWFCNTFNADLALSVAMTAISTLLSTFFLPANLTFYSGLAYGGSSGDILDSINFVALFISLVIVTCGIISGLFVSWKLNSARAKKIFNSLGSFSGICLILFSVILSGSGGEEESKAIHEHHWSFYVGVCFPCIIGLVLANIGSTIARLDKPERVTLAIECCYQNTGIATSAAISMFDGVQQSQALVVPLFYGIVEALVLGIYCIVAWKFGWTKAPSNENFCKIISKTYEVTDDDEIDHNFVIDKNKSDSITMLKSMGLDGIDDAYGMKETEEESNPGSNSSGSGNNNNGNSSSNVDNLDDIIVELPEQ